MVCSVAMLTINMVLIDDDWKYIMTQLGLDQILALLR